MAALDAESGRPVFFFDFASPWSYLAAERVNGALAVVPVWQPVDARALEQRRAPAREAPAAAGVEADRRPAARSDGDRRPPAPLVARVERRAAEQGLPPIRWPEPWPPDPGVALRAAIFAQRTGRVVAFSLAALRQAFAAGRDLGEVDSVLIAAAACELHPRAVLKGVESRAVAERLEAAGAAAVELGVRRVPAVAHEGEVLDGEDAVDKAVAALGRR